MVKFSHLDSFSEFFELEANPVEGQSLQQKDKRRRKRKGAKKLKNKKPTDIGHFLIFLIQKHLKILIS